MPQYMFVCNSTNTKNLMLKQIAVVIERNFTGSVASEGIGL